MPRIKNWIEEHFRKAQEEYTQGRYDNAKAELEIVLAKIKVETKKLKSSMGHEESLQKLTRSYRALSELNDYYSKTKSNLELAKAEKKRAMHFQAIVKGMHQKRILDTMRKNRKTLEEFRDRDRTIKESDKFVKILRRWNSYTPLLSIDAVENIGGGYFLAWNGTGVAIDPGINFIRNAVSAGLSIKDIDSIVLTHSHVDHTSDFEGIVTLFYEINDMRVNIGLDPVQFSLYSSIGAMNKFCNLVSFSYDIFREVVVMNPNSTYFLSDSLSVRTTPCKHRDLFCSHPSSCLGLKFYSHQQQRPIFAITSDTGYSPKLKTAFSDIKDSMVILHIGGIKDRELDFSPPPQIPIYKSHLGFRGVLNFLFDIRPSVAVISEFGEEFRGTRMSVSSLFEREFKGTTKVIPGDVGLTIEYSAESPHLLVRCSKCGSKVPIGKILVSQPQTNSHLAYLCPDCRKGRK